MTIRCHDYTAVAFICAELVRQGVTFEADTTTLTITLTGGY
jgi:hypothetical protein